MKLTETRKRHIDSLSHGALLSRWRFAPAGDPWFQGETGEYWAKRLRESRDEDPDRHVSEAHHVELDDYDAALAAAERRGWERAMRNVPWDYMLPYPGPAPDESEEG